MISVDWVAVRERVTALAAVPAARKVYGFGGHYFRLEPGLHPDELEELEEQLGVRLPDDYRGFLLDAGRGGAGPFFGVFPLCRTAGRWHWAGEGAELTALGRLAEPFPGTPPSDDSWVDDAFLESCEAADEAFGAFEHLRWEKDRTVGAISLCHRGRGENDWLVVSGPERGTIWIDRRADELHPDLTPMSVNGSDRTTFADWYLGWLETTEAEILLRGLGPTKKRRRRP